MRWTQPVPNGHQDSHKKVREPLLVLAVARTIHVVFD